MTKVVEAMEREFTEAKTCEDQIRIRQRILLAKQSQTTKDGKDAPRWSWLWKLLIKVLSWLKLK